MSELTGFTHANCTIAFDAIVQIITETLLGGRGIYLFKLGWIEPYKRPPRKMYRIDDKMGILLDENGEKISYIFPETNWIRFRMTEGFKFAFNPGVYKDWRTKK